MRITKHEHACLEIIRDDAATLVIDPGSFSGRLTDVENVAAVVITHEHGDHWTAEHVADLRGRFPDTVVLGPAGVVEATGDGVVEVVAPGDAREAGGFRLEFFGGLHAQIHPSMPQVDNVGVLVDGMLYHPGDSVEAPGAPVDVLAVPVGGPWLKLGEAMDLVLAVRPRLVLAIHESHLSESGMKLAERLLAGTVEGVGGRYVQLRPGDAFEV